MDPHDPLSFDPLLPGYADSSDGRAEQAGFDLTEAYGPGARPGEKGRSDAPIVAELAGRRRWTTRAVEVVKSLSVLGTAGFLFVLASAVMTVAAVFLVVGDVQLAHFRDPETMQRAFQRVFQSRLGLLMIVVLPQMALVAPPIFAAMISSEPTRRRLGLVRGRWPLAAWFAAAVAAPLVGMVSGVIVSLFFEQSAQLEEMSKIFRGHGQSGFLLPLALMIGVTPAICEELLFRGYLQNRLTQSLGPLTGILLASLTFAAFHMDFVHVVAVFPLGLFLGWISWHSGSLIPAMMAHFVNNVVSVVAVVLSPQQETDMLALPGALFSVAVLGLGLLGLAAVTATALVYGRPERAPQTV